MRVGAHAGETHLSGQVHDVSTDGRLARVYVAAEDNVEVLFERLGGRRRRFLLALLLAHTHVRRATEREGVCGGGLKETDPCMCMYMTECHMYMMRVCIHTRSLSLSPPLSLSPSLYKHEDTILAMQVAAKAPV